MTSLHHDRRDDAAVEPASNGGNDSGRNDARFCCNICLESVTDPVATQCGHLYCWPCLYRWLEPGMLPEEKSVLTNSRTQQRSLYGAPPINRGRRVCPVCKSSCSVGSLVPIYVRSVDADSTDVDGNIRSGASASDDELSILDDSADVRDHFNNPVTSHGSMNTTSTSPVASSTGTTSQFIAPDMDDSTGLRQRRGRQRSEQQDSQIPSRPAATIAQDEAMASPASNFSNSNNHSAQVPAMRLSPLAPATHSASLGHGVLMSFQRATVTMLGEAALLDTAEGRNQSAADNDGGVVPPLHRHLRQHSWNSAGDPPFGTNVHHEMEGDPGATEYLKRVLLVLCSFLILCLLIL